MLSEDEIVRYKHLNFNKKLKKIEYALYGNMSNYNFIDTYYLINQNNKQALCVIIRDHDSKTEKANLIYIININETNINIENIDIKKYHNIPEYIDSNTKIVHINLIKYIKNILSKSKIEYDMYYNNNKSKLHIYFKVDLESYKLTIEKSFNFEKQYLKNFETISDILKVDFKELLDLSDILGEMNKNKLDEIIFNMGGTHCRSKENNIKFKLNMSSAKFNNLKIIYNNYNSKKTITDKQLELFESLNDYLNILRKNPPEETKIIQIKGVRFYISNNIKVEGVYPYSYYMDNIPSMLKKYILTNCNIINLKAEIEKLIISN